MNLKPMSILDENDSEMVRLPGFWTVLAKFAFAASVPVFLLGVSWAAWVTNQVWSNTTEIAILKDVRLRPNGGVSQNVNVGSVDGIDATAESSAKTWLTTQEVAEREHVTDRTVLNYIEAGMIEPEPEKLGKTWHIAEHYRIVPKPAETCGNEGGSQ